MLSQSAIPSQICHAETTSAEAMEPGERGDLLTHLASITYPRKSPRVRHTLASLLAVAAAAVLAGRDR